MGRMTPEREGDMDWATDITNNETRKTRERTD